MILLGLVLSFTFYVILDFEYPRLGLIRIDDFEALLVQLRASMRVISRPRADDAGRPAGR